ncbi:DedA family protein [Nafulsella turpanensis]|uniref:DedA family protein n=1 Tax=Nafulsella turpanensis TaxID=1265690 RepID=UPI0003456B4F|nr:VTT domain-containing protein [Nafulsella turpanensis]
MEELVQLLMQLMNPQFLIHQGGLWLLLFIVFAENGLFFGFFLPGDSLLFMAGMLCGLPILDLPVHLLILYIILAASLGYILSYFIGSKFGKWLLRQPDSIFFKKKYLDMASSYFEKKHQSAIVVGRFIPVIRTFLPLCLGIIRADFRSFMLFNLLGALVWAGTLVLAGFLLKTIFPDIIHYIELVVISLIVITFVPLLKQYLKLRNAPAGN